MQPRTTGQRTSTEKAEHVCRPGWRQATYPDSPTKPILIPPTRTSSPPGTVWLCSCNRVWSPDSARPNWPNQTV